MTPSPVVGTLWSIVAITSAGPAHRAALDAQALERLRRGDLVDEVEVDVEERRLAVLLADDVRVPDLVEERSRGHSTSEGAAGDVATAVSVMRSGVTRGPAAIRAVSG